MEEIEKQAFEFVFKIVAKDAFKLAYRWWSSLRERRAAFTVLEIPRPIRPLPKKTKKRLKKKSPSVSPQPAPAALHGRFCPECGHEKGSHERD